MKKVEVDVLLKDRRWTYVSTIIDPKGKVDESMIVRNDPRTAEWLKNRVNNLKRFEGTEGVAGRPVEPTKEMHLFSPVSQLLFSPDGLEHESLKWTEEEEEEEEEVDEETCEEREKHHVICPHEWNCKNTALLRNPEPHAHYVALPSGNEDLGPVSYAGADIKKGHVVMPLCGTVVKKGQDTEDDDDDQDKCFFLDDPLILKHKLLVKTYPYSNASHFLQEAGCEEDANVKLVIRLLPPFPKSNKKAKKGKMKGKTISKARLLAWWVAIRDIKMHEALLYHINKDLDEEFWFRNIVSSMGYEPYFSAELAKAFEEIKDTDYNWSRDQEEKAYVTLCGVDINNRWMQTVTGESWISGDVINHFRYILWNFKLTPFMREVSLILSTHFLKRTLTPAILQLMMRDVQRVENMMKRKQFLFVPIYESNRHWSLGVIKLTPPFYFCVLDSLAQKNVALYEVMRKNMIQFLNAKIDQEFPNGGFGKFTIQNFPLFYANVKIQRDKYQCGAHVGANLAHFFKFTDQGFLALLNDRNRMETDGSIWKDVNAEQFRRRMIMNASYFVARDNPCKSKAFQTQFADELM